MTTARKEISRIEEKEILHNPTLGMTGQETIINEIIHFDFDDGILQGISDIFDDWEYGKDHGIFVNEDEDIYMIEVNACLDEIEDRIMADETPDKEDSQKEKLIKDYLEKYRGFDIWI
jgi:hypothetical protein